VQSNVISSDQSLDRQYVTGSLDYQRFAVLEYHRTNHEFCQARNRTTTAIWRNRVKRQSRSSLARSVAAMVIKPRSSPSSKPHAHPDIMPHQAPFVDAAYSGELPMGVARIDASVVIDEVLVAELTGNAEFHREFARADQRRFDARHGCNPRGVVYGWRCAPGLLALPFIAAGAVVAGAAG
jgi:hypothetical protein